MQPRTVRKELVRIEQLVNRAAEFSQRDASVPEEVKQAVEVLDRQAERVGRELQEQEDAGRIHDCVTQLAALGANVQSSCDAADVPDEEIGAPVRKAHKALVKLKRQIEK